MFALRNLQVKHTQRDKINIKHNRIKSNNDSKSTSPFSVDSFLKTTPCAYFWALKSLEHMKGRLEHQLCDALCRAQSMLQNYKFARCQQSWVKLCLCLWIVSLQNLKKKLPLLPFFYSLIFGNDLKSRSN